MEFLFKDLWPMILIIEIYRFRKEEIQILKNIPLLKSMYFYSNSCSGRAKIL
jgi:hypothetical protein